MWSLWLYHQIDYTVILCCCFMIAVVEIEKSYKFIIFASSLCVKYVSSIFTCYLMGCSALKSTNNHIQWHGAITVNHSSKIIGQLGVLLDEELSGLSIKVMHQASCTILVVVHVVPIPTVFTLLVCTLAVRPSNKKWS